MSENYEAIDELLTCEHGISPGMCPRCGSDEVYYENPNTGCGKYVCHDCEWEGEEAELGNCIMCANAELLAKAEELRKYLEAEQEVSKNLTDRLKPQISFSQCTDRIDELEQQAAAYRDIIRMDQPYSLLTIITRLCEAADILLDKHCYDGHDYEVLAFSRNAGREVIDAITSTPSPAEAVKP